MTELGREPPFSQEMLLCHAEGRVPANFGHSDPVLLRIVHPSKPSAEPNSHAAAGNGTTVMLDILVSAYANHSSDPDPSCARRIR